MRNEVKLQREMRKAAHKAPRKRDGINRQLCKMFAKMSAHDRCPRQDDEELTDALEEGEIHANDDAVEVETDDLVKMDIDDTPDGDIANLEVATPSRPLFAAPINNTMKLDYGDDDLQHIQGMKAKSYEQSTADRQMNVYVAGRQESGLETESRKYVVRRRLQELQAAAKIREQNGGTGETG